MAEELFKFVGGSAVLLAAVGWLIRSIILHSLNKDIEIHKETIRAEIARSSRLHEERAIVIRDIYAYLVDLIEKTHSFVHPAEMIGEPSKEEKQELVLKALLKFKDHFEKNKIYLSPDLCKRIQEFADSFVNPAAKFATFKRMSKTDATGQIAKEFHDSWFEAFDKMEKDVPQARAALEDEFREIMGIHEIK